MKFTKFFQWCFSQKALPYWCVLLLDCITVILSVFIVLTLKYGILYVVSNVSSLVSTLLVYLLCCIIGFKIFHTYSGVFRILLFVDLQRAGFAVMLGLFLIIIVRMIFSGKAILTTMQIADVVLSAFLSIMLLWTLRIVVKYLYDSITVRSNRNASSFTESSKEVSDWQKIFGIKIRPNIFLQDLYLRHQIFGINLYWECLFMPMIRFSF